MAMVHVVMSAHDASRVLSMMGMACQHPRASILMHQADLPQMLGNCSEFKTAPWGILKEIHVGLCALLVKYRLIHC